MFLIIVYKFIEKMFNRDPLWTVLRLQTIYSLGPLSRARYFTGPVSKKVKKKKKYPENTIDHCRPGSVKFNFNCEIQTFRLGNLLKSWLCFELSSKARSALQKDASSDSRGRSAAEFELRRRFIIRFLLNFTMVNWIFFCFLMYRAVRNIRSTACSRVCAVGWG